ncbi:MAG TPA: hypothetical protein VGD73_23585 [Pseudonocardia sp.]|uniref:hypothetical protein n=1 Tax=Pseudonocardia sp. TaxID=60912 RepID=UPI002ED95C8A
MLKKAGIVAAVVAAGLVAASPLAFADDGILNGAHGQVGWVNVQDSAGQAPFQGCNNSFVEGAYGYESSHQKNTDSHDGSCDQDNEYTDSSGSN